MNLSDYLGKLSAFKVIVESRTMREAALRLNVTQPSLTKLVQNLESASKARLLSRGRAGVAPTEAGKQLFEYACATLKGLEDLEQKLQHPSEVAAGHLRIGAWASLAEYLWPNFIPAFRKKVPALKLSIYTSEALNHQEALAKGDLDALVDAEPRLKGDLISWSLYEDRFNFYASEKASLVWDSETVQQAPIIYSPHAFDHDNKRINQHLQENGYSFSERIELDSFMAVMAFAKKGIGLAILPERLADTLLGSGQLKRVPMKDFSARGFGPHTFTVTIHEGRKDDPRLRLLIKSLRDWFKS